jgi:hypothetical protein
LEKTPSDAEPYTSEGLPGKDLPAKKDKLNGFVFVLILNLSKLVKVPAV